MKYLLVFFILSISLISKSISAQQITSYKFTGYKADHIYVKALNKIFMYGFVEDYHDAGLYSYDVKEHKIKKEVFFGAKKHIKVSADNKFLYASTGRDSIIVYNLPSLTTAYKIILPETFSSGYKISPTDPHLIAVQTSDNKDDYLTLYNHGIKLPNIYGGYYKLYHFEFSNKGKFIYAQEPLSNYFYQMKYNNSGLIAPTTHYDYIKRRSYLKIFNDMIYCSDGSVIDISDTIPTYFGRHTHFIQNQVGLSESVGWETGYLTYPAIITDSAQNQIIQIRHTESYSFLELFFFDINTLKLVKIKKLFVPRFKYLNSCRNQAIQFKDGLNFVYFSDDRLIVIEDSCSPILDFPNISSKFDSPVNICFPTELVLKPPIGYNAIFDSKGMKYDSIVFTKSGTYQFRVMDSQGCLSKPSKKIQINRSWRPQKPIIQTLSIHSFIESNRTLRCKDGKVHLRAKKSTNNDVSFLWSTGETKPEITVIDDTIVWVKALYDNGCLSNPSFINIEDINKITPIPPKIILENGNTNICNNWSLNLNGENGYIAYRWYNLTTDESSFSQKLKVSDEASLYLQAKDKNGCWSDFKHIHVLDFGNTFIRKATIKRYNNILSSDTPATHFQWYFNNMPIPNSNNPIYKVFQKGNYKLRIGNGQCWGELSDEIIIK